MASKPNSAKTVLVVEDEQPIRDMLQFNLERAGYSVRLASSGSEARAAIADEYPDVILMDWMLPDMSGLELTRQLKGNADSNEIPIIMLTARAAEDDRVAGLDGGADDYITKPFSTRELKSRIKAVLRRFNSNANELLMVEDLSLDRLAHRVTAAGNPVNLGPTEYRLLEFFMTHAERVYSRTQLLDRVWGGNVYVEERTVDVHIRRLRKALSTSHHDRYIQTVRGSGYRFSARGD
jgi:two-component system phosphate regulon response regulator PhoB